VPGACPAGEKPSLIYYEDSRAGQTTEDEARRSWNARPRPLTQFVGTYVFGRALPGPSRQQPVAPLLTLPVGR
jgi:hypothetical protein